ncbi:MAG: hypothetical protein EA383_02070 [Spirochaetaceae bacterium]|nr:MAG: hypothetical protein EA383_02070 [Spirochaetaceae bacterium]
MRRFVQISVISALLIVTLGHSLAAKELVEITPPDRMIHAPGLVAELTGFLERAAHQANELFPERFTVSLAGGGGGRPDYRLTVLGQADGRNSSLVLTMTRASDGRSAPVFPVIGAWDEHLPRLIAQAIRYLHQSFAGFDLPEQASQPVYLDEFASNMVSMLDTGHTARIFPYSVDVGPGGNIVIGSLFVAVELDRMYREVGKPGRELFTRDAINYAMDVRVSPGGTLFARTMGDDLFIIRQEMPRPQRVRLGMTMLVASAALSDGSYVATAGRGSVRVHEGRVEPLDLALHPNAWLNLLAGGPEATIWTWDAVTGAMPVFTAEGVRTDTMIPLMPEQDRRAVRALRVLEDGSFIALTVNSLSRFDRHGVPVWRMDGFPAPLTGDFSAVMSMAVDEERGYIYLLNPTAQRLVRLLDRDLARNPDPFDWNVAQIRIRVEADSREAFELSADDGLRLLARNYEQVGAYGLALEARRALLDRNPFDAEISDAFDVSEGLFIAGHASRAAEAALDILRDIGPETARPLYVSTVQQFEQAVSRLRSSPDRRSEVASALEAFRRSFRESEFPETRPPRMEIAGLSDLFPALIQTYLSQPAGTARITNTLDEELSAIRLTTTFRFADFPDQSEEIDALHPGESVDVPLFVTLSPDVLSLQEDIPVLMEFSLEYTRRGRPEQLRQTQTVMMRRNTALLWDDSGKLASFITPNDTVVQEFALSVLQHALPDRSGIIPTGMRTAAHLADALGVYGIQYVEDPNSPFTEVFGQTGALDTVRLPRTTLRLRSGDCDDTSALLASLYESVGIASAIMTSPGHVFIAFDTGEPAANRWMFEGNEITVIPHDGTLWVPVETTILDQGFVAAWTEASRLVRQYADDIEFLPLAEQRAVYPPIPTGPAAFQIVAPRPAAVSERARTSLTRLDDTLYVERTRQLATSAARADTGGNEWVRTQNRLGGLHARAGELASARHAFEVVASRVPDNVPALINLANLLLLEGDYLGAMDRAERVLEIRPRSVAAMNLALQAALVGLREDRFRMHTHERYALRMAMDLYAVDPELAGRIAAANPRVLMALVPGSGSTAEPRASLGGTDRASVLLWVVDDEG